MVRVVVLMQENKTPDFYFPTLASWGANIQNRGNLLTTPPLPDAQHDRDAWVHCKMGDYAPTLLSKGSECAAADRISELGIEPRRKSKFRK
jgi:hypothetical protein